MSQISSGPRVIVALDYPDADAALAVASRLNPSQCRLKVGFELFVSAGPALIERLHALDFQVFLDLKFHDIPNTVAGACRAAARLGVWMVNVHAAGGRPMMAAAREALESVVTTGQRPLLIAVTVLTSMDEADLAGCGVNRTVPEQAHYLAALTHAAGLDGVVCSAHEAGALKSAFGEPFLRVTPGIRPADAALGDQKRVMTPGEAICLGSSHLVIGRPVTQAHDPAAVLTAINQEIAAAA
ncbi:orotidine-5'-phosphate decarboxylase [Ectothiorhodospira lacustris]|uniref:orotidine-5'-phosphate decarboxylase n=1 Tax=Ectothiorhodospira lacustris TaxID=2899127 RepID=UPI001EE7829E|nr:orotidine-5'-phosphate decarboxylase [Ectothiorhodospira lacustris]MCG5501989.1 orotidine-5'-phosphate decarboxylase [Ectothiorhodospira lacustris]MCG5509316.1 orotidine-5'-phosphate decarboxylase [Ectothiorhodospira lacustris]MCG5521370.1 orotidine-5'-phosphate decarboxylase [Ectothiorhodospira lacustris]